MMNASLADLSSENRTEPVPQIADRLVTSIDAALEKPFFDLTQRKWIPDADHHREADHAWRAIEITEAIVHPPRLPIATAGLELS